MENKLNYLQELYGPENGALLYLLPTEINIQEQGVYDEWEKTLKKLAKCPFHPHEIRKCVCLEPNCPKKGLICFECFMDTHVSKCKKIKRIEEVAHFLQENERVLRKNEDDDGKMLKQILEDYPLPTLLEDFSSNLATQYVEFLEKVQPKNAEKVELMFDKGLLKNGEQVISQRLDLIGSLVTYGENCSFQGMMELQESKAQLIKKMDFFKEYLTKEIEAFQDKMRAAIGVTFNLKKEINFEKFKESVDNKKPEFEIEEIQKDEPQVMEVEEEEEKDSHPRIQKQLKRSLSIQQNIIKRLPHLPFRPESYWPVTSDKKERIKFKALRDRVQLLGFTQLKIVNFENHLAKFKVTLYETKIEQQDQDRKLTRAVSLKDPRQEEPILTQEIEIKRDKNEESNFVLFDFPALLKEGHEYVLELTAVKNYGFTCKYGLNNQRDLQLHPDNGILKFMSTRNEFEFQTVKNYEFVTDETQGLFPSLIYDIVSRNSSSFDCPSG